MIQLIKDLFRLSKYNTFFFLILRAGTRFAASNMVVRKKKSLQGSTTNNNLCEKLYGVKTMRLLECHTLAHQKGNKPDFRWCTLTKFVNIAGIFWSCFLRDTACISKEDFLSNTGMCFCGVIVAIDTVLRSLKGKILLSINKSWVQNFPRYESEM